jgi:hypothetical protein
MEIALNKIEDSANWNLSSNNKIVSDELKINSFTLYQKIQNYLKEPK